jgi:hypothetical protein
VFGLPEHAVRTLDKLQRLSAIHTPQQYRGSTAAYHGGGGGSSSSAMYQHQQQQQRLVPTATSVAVRAPVKSQAELDEMFDKVCLVR